MEQPRMQVLKLPEHYYAFMVDGEKQLVSNHASLCHLNQKVEAILQR